MSKTVKFLKELCWDVYCIFYDQLYFRSYVKYSYTPVCRKRKYQHKNVTEIKDVLNKDFTNVTDCLNDSKLSIIFVKTKLDVLFREKM